MVLFCAGTLLPESVVQLCEQALLLAGGVIWGDGHASGSTRCMGIYLRE